MTAVVLPDRKHALVLLAEHLLESLSTIKGSRVSSSKAKSAASHYEPCLACGGSYRTGSLTGTVYGINRGSGWITDRFKRRQPCEECGGHHVDDKPVKGTGRKGVDLVMNEKYRRVGSEGDTQAARVLRTTFCPICTTHEGSRGPVAQWRGTGVDPARKTRCRACEGQGRIEYDPQAFTGSSQGLREPSDDDLDEFTRSITRRDSAGDFHRLEVALAELARRSPHVWRVFHGLHVVKTLRDIDLDFWQRVWLQQAYSGLLNMMPTVIRVPRDLVYAERERGKRRIPKGRHAPGLATRDAEIRDRFAQGHGDSARVLAKEFGLSVQRVNEIIYQERVA